MSGNDPRPGDVALATFTNRDGEERLYAAKIDRTAVVDGYVSFVFDDDFVNPGWTLRVKVDLGTSEGQP